MKSFVASPGLSGPGSERLGASWQARLGAACRGKKRLGASRHGLSWQCRRGNDCGFVSMFLLEGLGMATMKNGKTNGKPTNRIAEALKESAIVIAAPNFEAASFHIYGTAPYVQHKFAEKARQQMLASQQSTKATSRKAKAPRDIEADFRGAIHFMPDGGYGIPAPAFRSAMIAACRVANFQMTKAKQSVFILQDAIGEDGTPLVRLIAGDPEMHQAAVRLESGVASIAVRPMWKEWEADVRIRWDADMMSKSDVANLLERAGQQVGIGEGRPASRKSDGMGWGTFTLIQP